VDAAYPLLDSSEEAQSERAALNDLMAVVAMHRGDLAQAQSLLRDAVAIDRQALDRARQAGQPFQRVSAALATHLQHLGDALRLNGSADASSNYEQAETLATEVLATYPNQDNTRFMLDLIRHGQLLAYRKGLTKISPAERIAAMESALDREFGQGFRRFKFGMSIAEVNSLFDPPFALDAKTLPRAGEYVTGDVRYLWIPISKSADFRDFYDLATECLNDDLDYVVFLFHEDSLIRISYRLYGPAKPGCRERRGLLPGLAARQRMPLLGTPKQWHLQWDTRQVSIIGTTLPQGPRLDIVAQYVGTSD
jgi:tetratricopeptide (TPR) repeat protein